MTAAAETANAATTEGKVANFRKLFPITAKAVYLNSCAKGALCTPVKHAYARFLEDWDKMGAPWQLWMHKTDEVKASFAGLIGASTTEIATSLSVSTATDSIASALEYRKRNKVVVGDQEYPTVAQIWLAQQRLGAKVEFVHSNGPCPTPDDYAKVVDENTLVVPLTHISFRNGSVLAVKEITQVCHRHGALVLLDDYQSTGTSPIDVKELGVDFLVTGMMKYMIGPPGLAFIYVREGLVKELQPSVTGWFARQDPFSLDIQHLDYADSARRFETGTFPIGAIYGSLAAFQVMKSLGLDAIAKQIALLARKAVPALYDLGFNVTTPRDSTGPMVAIETDRVNEIIERLAREKILFAARNNLFRVSFHAYNTLEEVDVLLEALQRLGR
jgi:selenocysteine lyase/cysteine desulfurase